MHGQQNDKYTEMHGQQNLKISQQDYTISQIVAVEITNIWNYWNVKILSFLQ